MHADPTSNVDPLTLLGLLTRWQWDWVAGPMLVLLTGAYLWGVVVLRRRGDAWIVARTGYWLLGMAQLAYATLGPLGVYDTVLFSVHMVQHMMLSMTIPVALAQGAPVTLALRVLKGRVRGALLWLIHSRLAKVLLFPPLTTGAMIVLPFALYPTGLYDLTLRNDTYHDLLHIWMLYMGSAFFMPLVGPDPTPWKLPYPIRILLFFLTMPFHAFIGTMLMGSKSLVAERLVPRVQPDLGPQPDAGPVLGGGHPVGDRRPHDARRHDRAVPRLVPGVGAGGQACGPSARSRGRGEGPRRGGDHGRYDAATVSRPRGHIEMTATAKVLLYSDDRTVREQVRLALGRRVAADLPELDIVDTATQPRC